MARTPNEILKSLPDAHILRAMEALRQVYDAYLGQYAGIHLNLKLLRFGVESGFINLEAHKDFHGITVADAHKRAAFAMHGIIQAHPVQVNTDANLTEAMVPANELFAFHVGMNNLHVNVRDLPKGHLRNFLFLLRHKLPDPMVLSSMPCLMEQAFPEASPRNSG